MRAPIARPWDRLVEALGGSPSLGDDTQGTHQASSGQSGNWSAVIAKHIGTIKSVAHAPGREALEDALEQLLDDAVGAGGGVTKANGNDTWFDATRVGR